MKISSFFLKAWKSALVLVGAVEHRVASKLFSSLRKSWAKKSFEIWRKFRNIKVQGFDSKPYFYQKKTGTSYETLILGFTVVWKSFIKCISWLFWKINPYLPLFFLDLEFLWYQRILMRGPSFLYLIRARWTVYQGCWKHDYWIIL